MVRPRPASGLAAALVLLGTAAAPQEGYRLTPTEVVVDRPAHWSAWQLPEGALELGLDGTVTPRGLQRRRGNAALDAHEYIAIFADADTVTGGVHAIGSGAETGSLVRDGRPPHLVGAGPGRRRGGLVRREIDLGRARDRRAGSGCGSRPKARAIRS